MAFEHLVRATKKTKITGDLTSTASGEGASQVGLEDAASVYAATDVEAALLEARKNAFIDGGTVAADVNNEITVAPRRRYQLTDADAIDGVIGLADGEFAQIIAPATGSTTLNDGGTPTAGQALELSGANKVILSTDEAVYTLTRVGSAIRVSGSASVLDEDDFASDSATQPPSQQSVKAFFPPVVYPVGQYAASPDRVTNAQAELQSAINAFKNPDETNLPGPVGGKNREFTGRILDLGGKEYAIESPLNIDNAHGLILCNGTLIATGASWTSGQAILEGDLALNLILQDLILECNQKSNGAHLNRMIGARFSRLRIQGFFDQLFGFKSTTTFGGLRMSFEDCHFFGMVAAEAGSATSATGIGMDIVEGSDCEINGGEFNRCAIGLRLAANGWRVANAKFTGNGAGPESNDPVGAEITSGTGFNIFTGNEFDNSYIKVRGVGKNNFIGNIIRWGNVAGFPASCIVWHPTAGGGAGQTPSNLFAVGNYGNPHSATKFLELLDDSTDTWTGTPTQCFIEGNFGRNNSGTQLDQRDTVPMAIPTVGTDGRLKFFSNTAADHKVSVSLGADEAMMLQGVAGANTRMILRQNNGVTNERVYALNARGNTESRLLVEALNDAYSKVRDLMEWHHGGEILQPNQPAFLCRPSADQTDVTGNSTTAVTLNCGTEVFDIGANLATNTFTAPAAGKYLLTAAVHFTGIDGTATQVAVSIVTSNRTYLRSVTRTGSYGDPENITHTVIADMDAGDTAHVEFEVNGMAGDTVDVITNTDMRTHFAGRLMG